MPTLPPSSRRRLGMLLTSPDAQGGPLPPRKDSPAGNVRRGLIYFVLDHEIVLGQACYKMLQHDITGT